MSSFPDAQEFYRHPLKGFAVLHGLIYRAFEDYWDFKDNYFPPLFVGGVLTLPRGPQVSVPRGEVWGREKPGLGEVDSSSDQVTYGAGAGHPISLTITFISKFWALPLRFRNWEVTKRNVGCIHLSPSLRQPESNPVLEE